MNFKTIFFTLFAFLGMQHAHAATITVTTTSDVLDSNTSSPDGYCSLREATININDQGLTYADCTDGSLQGFGVNDTIILTSGQTYQLTLTDSSTDSDETNDLELTNDFILTTTSSDHAIIEANFTSSNEYTRILTGDNINNVTFENIDFAGGELNFGSTSHLNSTGANVNLIMLGGNTNIINCIFRDGTITSTSTLSGYGAGLYYKLDSSTATTSTITISQTEFYDNSISTQATRGAHGYAIGAGAYLRNDSSFDAIYNISESSFHDNEAYSPASATEGIAIYIMDFNEGSISKSYFHSNTNLGGSSNSILYLYNNNASSSTNHTISQSTFSNNTNESSATGGPAIECTNYAFSVADLNLNIVNSTVSQNDDMDGVSSLACHVKISHSTIYENTNGIYHFSGEMHLINTIVANNTLEYGTARDCYSNSQTVTYSHGSNFISDSSGCNFTNVSSNQPADIFDQSLTLASLSDNGGATPTHAFLNAPNDAIDGGTCLDVDGNTITTDQRGEDRTQGLCDIGAFEQVFYEDTDGDGFGSENSNTSTTYANNFSIENNDCDDNEPTAFVGNDEVCGDGIDNDCDGDTDEIEDEICDDGIDNDCDGDFDENECIDPNPSSGGSGGSNGSSNDDNVTCEALTPECMGEEAYQDYLDSLEESENEAAGNAGGCGCNVASQVPFSSTTLLFSFGAFLSLFALRWKQKS